MQRTVQSFDRERVGIVEWIRLSAPSLVPSEERVARAVLNDPTGVLHQSVTELAAEAQTSISTVVRCCQNLGLRGFQDLKIALAREIVPAIRQIQGDLDRGDEPDVVAQKVLNSSARALDGAASSVDALTFRSATDALVGARRVLFVGVGTSAPLAHDAAYRFTTIGIVASAPADNHVQHVAARHLEPPDVCLAVSHTGSTRETLSTMKAAKDAGAVTIAITSFARSPLVDLVDLSLVGGSRETLVRVEAMSSRVVHLVLLDALLVAVAVQRGAQAQRALDATAEVLIDHRY